MQVISQSGTKSAITINSVKQITSGKNRKLKNALKKLENIIEEGSQLLSPLASTVTQLVRLVVNDRKFLARIVFFSHTKPASSNNLRSYTIVSAPAEQAD